MIRFNYIIISGFTLVLLSCNAITKYDHTKIEGSKNTFIKAGDFAGVIFNHEVFTNRISVAKFTPSVEEIFKAERIFKNCLKSERADSNGVIVNAELIKPTSKYYRQYFGTINSSGEKVIKFNSMLKNSVHDFPWQREEMLVHDGGNAYFQVMVNITTGECYDFYVNGGG